MPESIDNFLVRLLDFDQIVGVEDASQILAGTARDVALSVAEKPAFVPTHEQVARSLSPLGQLLDGEFPGRPEFCERLGQTLACGFQIIESQNSASVHLSNGLRLQKPNILVLAPEGAGKTHLLSQVLPEVIPKYFESRFSRKDALVAYLDAEHLREVDRSIGSPFGPLQCAQLLVQVGTHDAEAWRDSVPVVVCVDQLEKLWGARSSDSNAGISSTSLSAALAAVIRGLTCRTPVSRIPSGRPKDETLLNTRPIIFVAAADSSHVRQAMAKVAGETGALPITPSILVAAGVPESLATELRVVLPLPRVNEHAYRCALRDARDAGFASLSRLCETLGFPTHESGSYIAFEPEAMELLFRLTWNGHQPLFSRLAQLLHGLTFPLVEMSDRSQPVTFTIEHVTEAELADTRYPVDLE